MLIRKTGPGACRHTERRGASCGHKGALNCPMNGGQFSLLSYFAGHKLVLLLLLQPIGLGPDQRIGKDCRAGDIEYCYYRLGLVSGIVRPFLSLDQVPLHGQRRPDTGNNPWMAQDATAEAVDFIS